MGLSWYNGFSPEQRMEADRIQKAAIREGLLTLPKACCLCGLDQGPITPHLEDYSKPLDPEEIKPLCVKCHLLLHLRFRHPNAWRNHLYRVRFEDYVPRAYRTPLEFMAQHPFHGPDEPPVPKLHNPPTRTWAEMLTITRSPKGPGA